MHRKGRNCLCLLFRTFWFFCLLLYAERYCSSIVVENVEDIGSRPKIDESSRDLSFSERSVDPVQDVYGVTGQATDRLLLVSCVDGALYGVDPLDGSLLWKSRDPYGPYVTSLAHPGVVEAASGEMYVVEAIGHGTLHYYNGQEGGLFYRLPLSMRQLAVRSVPYRCPDGRYVMGSKRSNLWRVRRSDGAILDEDALLDGKPLPDAVQFVRSDYFVNIKEGRRKKDSRTAWSVAYSDIALASEGKQAASEDDDSTTTDASVDDNFGKELDHSQRASDKWYKASLEPCAFNPNLLRLPLPADAKGGKVTKVLPSFQVAPHLFLYSNLEEGLFVRNIFTDEIEWFFSVPSPVVRVFQCRWKKPILVVPLLDDAAASRPGNTSPWHAFQSGSSMLASKASGKTKESPISAPPTLSNMLDHVVRVSSFPLNTEESNARWTLRFLFPNATLMTFRQLFLFPDLGPTPTSTRKDVFPSGPISTLPWMYGRSLDYFSPEDSASSNAVEFPSIQRSFLYFPKNIQQRLMVVGSTEPRLEKHKLEGARLLYRSPSMLAEGLKMSQTLNNQDSLRPYLPPRLLLEASSPDVAENDRYSHYRRTRSDMIQGWPKTPYLLLPPSTPVNRPTVIAGVEGPRVVQGWFAWFLTWFILLSLSFLLLTIWFESFRQHSQSRWLNWIFFWRENKILDRSPLWISDEVLGYGSHGTVVFKGTFRLSASSIDNNDAYPSKPQSPTTDRSVAIKRFLLDFYSLAEHEIRLLTTSDHHPNILRYFYHEQRPPFLYLALEYCPATLLNLIEWEEQYVDNDFVGSNSKSDESEGGVSLSRSTSSNSLEAVRLPVVCQDWYRKSPPMRLILRGLMDGLFHLHKLGIVHRDMKPANVLCSLRMDRLLISDFGVSKHIPAYDDKTGDDPSPHPLNVTGGSSPTGKKLPWKVFDPPTVCGTVGWRAPEILLWESVQLFEREKNSASNTSPKQSTAKKLSAPAQPSDTANANLYKMPFQLQAATDVFSSGCLIFYALTGGYHPYGSLLHLESNIIKGDCHFEAFFALFPLAYPYLFFGNEEDRSISSFTLKSQSLVWVKQWLEKETEPCLPEAYDLICRMIHKEAARRPTMAQVLAHPFFWTCEKRLAFLQDVSDRISMTPEYVKDKKELEESISDAPTKITPPPGFADATSTLTSSGGEEISSHWIESSVTLSRSLQHIWKTYPQTLPVFPKDSTSNWFARLDPLLASLLRHDRRRSYHPAKLSDMLRALRNKRHHYQDLPLDVRSVLGPVPDGFLTYWTSRFPMLVLVCWQAVFLSGLLDDPNETVFRSYYVLDG